MKAAVLALCVGIALPGLALSDSTTAVQDLHRGAAATVAGRVERITDDDEFLLTDETGSILIYIGPNRMPVRQGERIRVSGTVDDDDTPLELYATEIVLQDGEVVTLPNRD